METIKTAEEFLQEVEIWSEEPVLRAMEQYAAQFKHTPPTGDGDVETWLPVWDKASECATLGEFAEYMEQQGYLSPEQVKDLLNPYKELLDFIGNIHGMTTTEFCSEFDVETPKWNGSTSVSVMDFLALDAKKLRFIIEKYKATKQSITSTPFDDLLK